MHSKGYVVTVRQNGQTVKEESGKFTIPFHSEYQIRLRNKTRMRAVADVYIDGRLATKNGIVINANDFVDLERFVEDNLLHGNKFKFVPKEDGRVADKNEPENSCIEVKFYSEKEEQKSASNQIWVSGCSCHTYGCHSTWCYLCQCYHHGCHGHRGFVGGFTISSSGVGGGTSSGSFLSGNNITYTANAGDAMGMNINAKAELSFPEFNSAPLAEAGATVEGSKSDQKFTTTNIEVDRSNPVTIAVQLLGIGPKIPRPNVVPVPQKSPLTEAIDEAISALFPFCSGCGRKKQSGENFCPACGKCLQ